jgi:hypothetical protein
MSTGFEAVAGSFAVVGVADVLVRTGRELYRFLCDVADAPQELVRLREAIRETLILYQNSKRFQDDLRTGSTFANATGALSALEPAVRALHRELQSLKVLVARFRGTKTWSRIKYVLNEAKVIKAINNLESAKTLLANSLTLAHG